MDVVSYIERSHVNMGPRRSRGSDDEEQNSSDYYSSDDGNDDPNNLARPPPGKREIPAEWSATTILNRPTAVAWEKFLNSIPSSRPLDFSDICGAGPEVAAQLVSQTPLPALDKALVLTEFQRRRAIMTRVHSHKIDRLVTVWEADDSTKVCLTCQREFSMRVRRHHCRRCGRVFCDECCNQRMVLPSVHAKHSHRICRLCHDDVKAPHCIKCRPDIYEEIVKKELEVEEQQLAAPLEQLTVEREAQKNAEKIERQRKFIEEVKRQHLPELEQLSVNLQQSLVTQGEALEVVEEKTETVLANVEQGAKDIEAAEIMSRSLVLVPEEAPAEQSEETKRLIAEFLENSPSKRHAQQEIEERDRLAQTGYTYLSANLPGSPVPVGVTWFVQSGAFDALSSNLKQRLSNLRNKKDGGGERGGGGGGEGGGANPGGAEAGGPRKGSVLRRLSWTSKKKAGS